MKSPAFQFYPGDWLSSPKIMLMTPAQEGGYIRLLCYAWADPNCSLPDDDETLAALSRLGEGWFKGGSTVIRKCFKQVGTTLVNERLLREREKQRLWAEKSRKGGLNSGVSRSCNRSKGGSRVVEPKVNTSSSFSSSISSSNNKEEAVAIAPKAALNSKKKLSDEEWLTELRRIYDSLNIDEELRKIDGWLLANPGRQRTRQFVVNWLNRATPLKTPAIAAPVIKLRPSGESFLK